MIEREYPFLNKALESLYGAESEFVNERYNNTANRAYYAVFHAAIAALQQAEMGPAQDEWSHEFVPGQFDGVLINRRKLYPTELRGVLSRNAAVRLSADYTRTRSPRLKQAAPCDAAAPLSERSRREGVSRDEDRTRTKACATHAGSPGGTQGAGAGALPGGDLPRHA